MEVHGKCRSTVNGGLAVLLFSKLYTVLKKTSRHDEVSWKLIKIEACTQLYYMLLHKNRHRAAETDQFTIALL